VSLRRVAATAVVLALTLLGVTARAAPARVTVDVDPNPVGTSDRLRVSIVVEGEDASDANLPAFPVVDGLRSLGGASTSESQNVVIDGGGFRRTVTRTISYSFLPERAGDVTIPALDVTVGKQTVRTQPQTVHVIAGSVGAGQSGGRAPSNDPFDSLFRDPLDSVRSRTRTVDVPEMSIRRTASATHVYAGEPIRLTVELWVGPGEGHIEQAGPVSGTERSGFWVENLKTDPRATARTEERAGRVFTVFTLSQDLLYATQTGKLVLPAESWRVVYRPSAFSLLSPAQEIFPKSDELPLDIDPLPTAGRPADFSGLVGQFEVKSDVDRERGKVGDAVTWRISVSGKGNLRTAGELPLPKPDAFEVFSSKANDDVHASETGLEGARTTEQVLIPRSAGTLTVPPLALSYFDPHDRVYKRAEAPGHRIVVEGGAPVPAVVGPASQIATARPVQQGTDIRYIKSAPGGLKPERDLSGSTSIWLLALLAPAANVGLWWRRQRTMAEGRDPLRLKRRQALAQLEKTLSVVRDDESDALARISGALVTFLHDRFGIPRVEVTAARLREGAAEHGLPSDRIEDLVTLLRELDAARFGGVSGGAAGVAKRVRELAKLLEAAS